MKFKFSKFAISEIAIIKFQRKFSSCRVFDRMYYNTHLVSLFNLWVRSFESVVEGGKLPLTLTGGTVVTGMAVSDAVIVTLFPFFSKT